MALAAEVNAFVSQHEPWKVVKTDPEAALGILSVAYDAVCDLNVLFTPFLPHGAQRVWDNLGVDVTVPLPVQTQVGEGEERHRVMRTFGQHPFPANIVYRLALAHIRAVGVYFAIEPATA